MDKNVKIQIETLVVDGEGSGYYVTVERMTYQHHADEEGAWIGGSNVTRKRQYAGVDSNRAQEIASGVLEEYERGATWD